MDEPVNPSIPYYVILDLADSSIYFKSADEDEAISVFEKAQTSRHEGHKTLALTCLEILDTRTSFEKAPASSRTRTEIAVEMASVVAKWNAASMGSPEGEAFRARIEALSAELDTLPSL